MATRPINILSLCSGVGGLELGLHLALGERARTVCYVEREAYAASDLVARMEDSSLDQAPIWDDLLTFDGSPWRGSVDIVSAGFPCQPWSHAGKRAGTDDSRWLWPAVLRIIMDVEPGIVFLENVPGLVTGHGLEHVLSDLAEAGFDAEWDHFSAAETGASHRRERVFVLAYRNRGLSGADGGESYAGADRWHNPEGCCACVADCQRPRRSEAGQRCNQHTGAQPETGDGMLAHTGRGAIRQHNCVGWQPQAAAGTDCQAVANTPCPFPPGPGDAEAWGRIIATNPELRPALPDLGGKIPDGVDRTAALESAVRRMADGMASRVDRLRACGNGVVPIQAAYAFRTLWANVNLTPIDT